MEAVDLQTDETTAFLNKGTCEIVTILAEEFNAVANQEPLQNSAEWERADRRVAQEILGNERDFLRLPIRDKKDIMEWQSGFYSADIKCTVF